MVPARPILWTNMRRQIPMMIPGTRKGIKMMILITFLPRKRCFMYPRAARTPKVVEINIVGVAINRLFLKTIIHT
jgi:hypothetical protein